MREFTITVTYVVNAHDRDEAVDIAKTVREALVDSDQPYRLRDIETQTIEEV